MNILFLSSEVAPFAKTGGLGDVSGSFPRYLRARGHDVRVVTPFYPRVRGAARAFSEVLPPFSLLLGARKVAASLLRTPLPGTDVPVYFVRCPSLFDRAAIYTRDADEHVRFAGLTWAALAACQHLQWAPDIVHCNDWQTALAPLALKTLLAWDKLFQRTRTVLTIHNIGYQGTFDAQGLADTGFAEVAHHFHQDQLREGRVNPLLTGILYADAITTVSPTYAREICTPEHGVGMDPFLRMRRDVLRGVLNGIDEVEWDPARDALLPHRYDANDLSGKERNKAALCRAMRLPYAPTVPVVGVVSRMVWQKGYDLCVEVLPHLLRRHPMQVVVLGTGEARYERFFAGLADAFPQQVAYKRAFSEPMAHLIEAGSDMFLMPSRYEPCGLNQMYSLRYGTPPIVHRTGGLADTVHPWDSATRRGNGFVFEHFNDGGLGWAMHRALECWGDGRGDARATWQALQRNGMSERLGWDERVGEYEAIYRALVGPR